MNTIYVGDSKNIIKRIRFEHCRGNVEASALRKSIADYNNYNLIKEKRHSGSMRIRINLPDSRDGEQEISAYLQSGIWKYVLCESYDEAHDFQWYVINRLKPTLNKNYNNWNAQQETKYSQLFTKLTNNNGYNCSELANHQTGPGVYVLYHTEKP